MEVIRYPDPWLELAVGENVQVIDYAKQMADAMLKLMYKEGGVGLASTQVGYRARMLVMNADTHKSIATTNNEYAILNPRVLHSEGSQTMREGCLSLPGIAVHVTRPSLIEVTYMDIRAGLQTTTVFEGRHAQIVQHEIDHLDGLTIIDRMSPADKRKFNSMRRYASKH